MFNSIKNIFARRRANKLWKTYDIVEEELCSIAATCLDTKSLDLKYSVSIYSDRIKILANKADELSKEVDYRYKHEK